MFTIKNIGTKIQKNISNFKLGRKIMLIVLACIFLISGFSMLAYYFTVRSNNHLLYSSTADNLSYSASNLSSHIDNIQALSTAMIADDTLQDMLSMRKDSGKPLDPSSYSTLCTTLESYLQQYQNNSLSYIMLAGDEVMAKTYIPLSDRLPVEVIRELIKSAKGHMGRSTWVTQYSEDYGLFLVREIRRTKNARLDSLGYVIIRVNSRRMLEDCSHFSNQYGQASYLLANEDSVIQSSITLSEQDSKTLLEPFEHPYRIQNLSGDKYFVVKNTVPNVGWDFFCLVPYGTVYDSILVTRILFVAIVLLSILLSLLLSTHFIRSLTRHIDNLICKIQSFAREDATFSPADFPFDYTERKDELGLLHQQFDQMALQIQQLIHVNYKNELLVKDAQLKALETQINPHFLYNTLESINWRAKASGEKDISKMVEALGFLLRAALSQSSKTVPLRQELDFVHCYLTIQETRYEDQLVYTMEVDEALNEVPVPKLLIQPLVENAIQHALEEMVDTCRILIRVYHDSRYLYIQVENSGSSFPDHLLEKLSDKTIKPEGFGIGLTNINQRIQLTYGKEYGLEFFNRDGFAVARIRLPFQGTAAEGIGYITQQQQR